MEALYAKLYDKYENLKKKKFSDLEDINREHESKFMEYVAAAEDMIQHLKHENDKLSTQVKDLRSEVDSIRSTSSEQYVEYQKHIMEENQKNKALSKEIERIRKLHQEETSSHSKHASVLLNTSKDAQTTSASGSTKIMTRKRKRELASEREESIVTPGCSDRHDDITGELAKNSSKQTPTSVYDQLPECCKRTVNKSGGVVNDNGPPKCVFQALFEYTVGMELSVVSQTEGMCISALHQSSGYSFSLTWVEYGDGKEPELLYRVLYLGTIEKVAAEWMKEDIVFSTSMCPLFFERVARGIKGHR